MDVKLFDENAPFQVKGLHIAREIKNMQRLLLFFLQREEKKRKSRNTDLYHTQAQMAQGGKKR